MKKLILAISVIAAFASCEKQTAKVETGMIKVTPMVEKVNDNSIGKKDAVNRGTVPVYVSAINVNTNMDGRTTDTHFDIVDDGSGVDAFVLEDVPLGYNTIAAVTEPNAPVLRHFFRGNGFGVDGDALNENSIVWTILDAAVKRFHDDAAEYTQDNIPPYAIYNGSATTTLIDGVEANVAINMDTEYARSVFSVQAEKGFDLAHYTVVVVADFKQMDGNVVYHNVVNYASGAQAVYGIWSDEDSKGACYIDLNFKWYADEDLSTVLNEKTATIPLTAKVDMYTRITLNRSSFVMENVGLTFDFDTIDPDEEDILID